ncbi:GntR family transcriptional regulator [Pseudalkalibacillus sp. Hm43]|uniref:GntR family transcriptional regulator n=1 Tax=Pseudalkalibacillus sp. Hm43 TaxID=3450742 RepID=UPI003F41B945
MLDKHSSLPLYSQVELYLKEEIQNGGYHTGDLVPSERELSEKFQISRMTVRQAINNMVNSGELYRERGKGTFVAAPKLAYPLKGVFSFTDDMKRRGLTPSTNVISFETIQDAPPHIYRKLERTLGSRLHRIKRVRLADDEPVAVETAYLPYQLFSEFTEWHSSGSIYEYVRNTLGREVTRANQRIEASVAGDQNSVRLGIRADSPVLIVNRKTYLDTGEPFEYVQTVFRSDKYSFSIEVEHEKGDDDVSRN